MHYIPVVNITFEVTIFQSEFLSQWKDIMKNMNSIHSPGF